MITQSFYESDNRVTRYAEALAARVGRSADELPVRAYAGAVIGAGIAVWLTSAEGIETADYIKQFDAAMAYLDTGLQL